MTDPIVVAPAPKPMWQSKTIWAQGIALIAVIAGAKWPSIGDFLKTHFAEVGGGWAILNMALRLISNGKVQIS